MICKYIHMTCRLCFAYFTIMMMMIVVVVVAQDKFRVNMCMLCVYYCGPQICSTCEVVGPIKWCFLEWDISFNQSQFSQSNLIKHTFGSIAVAVAACVLDGQLYSKQMTIVWSHNADLNGCPRFPRCENKWWGSPRQ